MQDRALAKGAGFYHRCQVGQTRRGPSLAVYVCSPQPSPSPLALHGSYDHDAWVDVSSCTGLKLIHQSDNDYAGFRLSFGNAKAPGGEFFSRGYKANFAPNVGFFGAAMLPFNTFTDDWSDYASTYPTRADTLSKPQAMPPVWNAAGKYYEVDLSWDRVTLNDCVFFECDHPPHPTGF